MGGKRERGTEVAVVVFVLLLRHAIVGMLTFFPASSVDMWSNNSFPFHQFNGTIITLPRLCYAKAEQLFFSLMFILILLTDM